MDKIELIDVFGACNMHLKAKALGKFPIKKSKSWIFPPVLPM
jgi:hypothetical protein